MSHVLRGNYMKKLYKVKVEDVVYVMAKSGEEALDIARYESDNPSWRDGGIEEATRENFDESTGWNLGSIPFGEEELTIDEIFNEG
jgi:hypothetical protein